MCYTEKKKRRNRKEKEKFEVETFTFYDKIKANIYEDLYIDFIELDLET